MDPVTVALTVAVGTTVVSFLGKILGDRANKLVSTERDRYDTRFEIDDTSDAAKALREIISELREERESGTNGGATTERLRLEALETRFAELETLQASHRDFAVQREYHALGLAQSKISFTLGYVFGALGALLVLAGATKALFFADTTAQATAGILTAVAGVIPEALAGLLFVSASSAGKRMDENFDRGRADRDLAAAQQIAADMEDRVLGDRLQAVLALSMARASIDEASLRLVEQIAPAWAPRPAGETASDRSGDGCRWRRCFR